MFDKILEYQKTEGAIIKLETELSKSGDREKAAQIQQELKNYHSRLLVLEENAKKVNAAYSKAIAKYQEYNEKLAELEEINNLLLHYRDLLKQGELVEE